MRVAGEAGVEKGCGDFEVDGIWGWRILTLAKVIRDNESSARAGGNAGFEKDRDGEVGLRDQGMEQRAEGMGDCSFMTGFMTSDTFLMNLGSVKDRQFTLEKEHSGLLDDPREGYETDPPPGCEEFERLPAG